MFDRGRRVVLATVAGAAVLGLMAEAASAQAKFKAVTTFTVIADMARNVAGDAAIVEVDHQAGRRDPQLPADAAAISCRRRTPISILWNGLNLELWFEQFFAAISSDVPSVVVTDGIEPMGIGEGPYTGKPNPHAWMSPTDALIYVENIREAFAEARSGQCRDLRRQCRGLYGADQGDRSRRSAPRSRPFPKSALAGDQRGRLQLSDARFRPEGTLSLADQCRPAGHAAAGPQGDRRGARATTSRRSSRESTISRQAGQAGRARDRREIWRRALCRLAERRRRPGADLSRPAARHRPTPSPRASSQ